MIFFFVGEIGGFGEFVVVVRGVLGRSDWIGGGFVVIGGDFFDRFIGNGMSLGLEEVGIVFVFVGFFYLLSRYYNCWGRGD